jgi:gliding motility-associated-like protein
MRKNVNAAICPGQSYTLPSGQTVDSAGVFTDTIKTVAGCDSIITTTLAVLQPVVNSQTAFICDGATYTLPWGGTVSTGGVYGDTLRNTFGCDSLINKVILIVQATPVVSISKSNDVDCVIGTTQLTASGGIGYAWQPAASLSNANIYNPVASPSATTVYHVTVSSGNGCYGEDSITVQVMTDEAVNGYQLPTAFTPNGDGYNDCFGVKSWGAITNLNFNVYNRVGNLIFTTRDPSQCWDGTYNGIKQLPGTYVYIVTAQTVCGKVSRKGTVVLIR